MCENELCNREAPYSYADSLKTIAKITGTYPLVHLMGILSPKNGTGMLVRQTLDQTEGEVADPENPRFTR